MLSLIEEFLFPKRCAKCGAPKTALCNKCSLRIRFSQPLDAPYSYAIYDYQEKVIQNAIKSFKYYRKKEPLRSIVKTSIPHIDEYISSVLQYTEQENMVCIPIPEHLSKERKNGYSHTKLIAHWIAESSNTFCVKTILKKTHHTLPQAKLSRSDRLRNVEKSMEATQRLDPHGVYIVIDDVTTTGATFVEARRALNEAGARKIMCIAIAHGYATN
jgi:ComF family protein